MHLKNSNQLALSSKAQNQAMKKVLKVVSDNINNNKNLPSVHPSLHNGLSYLDKREDETEITTEESSSSLRLSKEQVGRYCWTVLHSMASGYPLVADKKHQNAIKTFIEDLYG